MADQPRDGAAVPARRCPVCGKPQAERYRPFCSKRCADVDLSRWLGGVYKIASDEEPAEVSEGKPGLAPPKDKEA